ncbi:MAG: GNAT family N-acetyltransferase [Pseudomonadota bacterium]
MTEVVTAGAALKGTIRTLSPSEMPLLRDHLLRLDRDSRRNRFNGVVDDSFIEAYAARSARDGTIVVAYLTGGEVHGAAELHQPEKASSFLPEMAFSVERDVRRQGLGSKLFEKVLDAARRAGFERVRITTGSENEPMKALARKFGAHLTFAHGESTGIIELDQVPSPSIVADDADMSARAARRRVVTPADATIAALEFNRWYWRQMFRAWTMPHSA